MSFSEIFSSIGLKHRFTQEKIVLGFRQQKKSKSVLVVEDDKNILNLLSAYLENVGHQVVTATDGIQGLEIAFAGEFDIYILDVMLPQKSGIEIASTLRGQGDNTPILFLTALGNEVDILKGFDVGADDYMVKPFSPRELIVRIEAIIRRAPNRRPDQECRLAFGPLVFDDNQPICWVNNKSIELTPHEFSILQKFLARPNQIFNRSNLIAGIYGNEDAVSPKAIDVHVHNLRSKLGVEVAGMIQTVRGFGYKFTPKSDN